MSGWYGEFNFTLEQYKAAADPGLRVGGGANPPLEGDSIQISPKTA